MSISSLAWLAPLLLLVLVATAGIAISAVLSDLAAWVSRARRTQPPALATLFHGWPLVLWIAAAALLPDLEWRVTSGVIAVEHGLLLLVSRPDGRIIAGE